MSGPRAYFDTSILVKRYVNEEGSFRARRLMRDCQCVSSEVMPLETLSAISRRRSLGEITEPAFAAISSLLKTERTRWELVAVDNSVLNKAEEVIRNSAIKALDAIHIASALLFQANLGTRIPFVSADARQLNAASAFGLRIERS